MKRWYEIFLEVSKALLPFQNALLKLTSLVLAFVIWSTVVSQQRGETTEMRLATPLIFSNIPQGITVTSGAQVSRVDLLVRIPRTLISSLSPSLLQFNIDLASQTEGEVSYSLSENNLSYGSQSVPKGLKVLSVSPSSISLRLERNFEKLVSVLPRYYGNPKPGLAIGSIETIPSQIDVAGPQSALSDMTSIFTLPINISDIEADTVFPVEIDMPDNVRIAEAFQDTQFEVSVLLSPNTAQTLVRDIPIVFENQKYSFEASVKLINAHLEGAEEDLKNLDEDKVYASVNLADYPPGDYRGLTPKLILPKNIKALEQWPILDLFVKTRRLAEEPKN